MCVNTIKNGSTKVYRHYVYLIVILIRFILSTMLIANITKTKTVVAYVCISEKKIWTCAAYESLSKRLKAKLLQCKARRSDIHRS